MTAPQPVTADELATIRARHERAMRQMNRLLDAHGPTHQEAALARSMYDVPRLVAEIERLRELIAPPCRECRQGKHGNCDGGAWDELFNDPTECPCAERGHA